MIAYLLDTDCSIYAMLGTRPALRERLADCQPDEVGISAVSFAEIVMGENLGHPPDREVIEDFVSVVPVLPFDEAAAREYAKLPFKRARFDRLLAAHALSIGATVVTNNVGDFADVPGLVVENWTV
ncbi:MAG: type II toxin-antitoxin system VapC family toxin [Novosphingobium sp.]|uniref:type II toxin-antitoxin system VapC family toxin n=1 Tax=Novosphingobium sp. TaxID=1874826 RepID=UPI0027336D37|nr:type II toxin-antitoxin system VapC family toxin [Novosphingobium sp.]MDP3551045.1 type II toxin-antitoxin system VapC family toxin [Novosphingobium sp.]